MLDITHTFVGDGMVSMKKVSRGCVTVLTYTSNKELLTVVLHTIQDG